MLAEAKYADKLLKTKLRKQDGRLEEKKELARETLYEQLRMVEEDMRGREEQVLQLRTAGRKRAATLSSATDEVEALRDTANQLCKESTDHAERRQAAEAALQVVNRNSKKHKSVAEAYQQCEDRAFKQNPALVKSNAQLAGQLNEWTSWWSRLPGPVQNRLLHAPPHSKDKRFNPECEHFGDALDCDGW
jgi:hypothetical protein